MYTDDDVIYFRSIMDGENTIYNRPIENEFEELANWMCMHSYKTIAVLCGSMKKLHEYRKLYDAATKNKTFEIFNIIKKNNLKYLEYNTSNRVIFALSPYDIKGQAINYLLIGNEIKIFDLEKTILPTMLCSSRNIVIYIKET